MTILGLKCLLENILDERLDLHSKNIQKIETYRMPTRSVIKFTFCDNWIEEFTIFEREGYEDEE